MKVVLISNVMTIVLKCGKKKLFHENFFFPDAAKHWARRKLRKTRVYFISRA